MSLENVKQRRQEGFGMVALGSDAGLVILSVQSALTTLGRDSTAHLRF